MRDFDINTFEKQLIMGEEFRLDAEIGVCAQKLHARVPFALEKLVTEK